VRLFEQTPAIVNCVGKSPLFVPEQLTLEQVLRDRTAVHGHEGSAAAVAAMVHGPRDQLFTDAALARNEHGRLVVRNLGDGAEDLLHPPALRQNVLEAVFLPDLVAKHTVLAA
jgi:hypothetical protein